MTRDAQVPDELGTLALSTPYAPVKRIDHPEMLPRPRFRPTSLRLRKLLTQHATPRRTLIAAPRPGSGPLMERRADRALPSISSTTSGFRRLRTLPIFVILMTGSVLAIFNYQKTSSSVVSSTLYALRTNPEARQVLGNEIYFANQIPWISGELNQLHGRIDISFWVKGTKKKGLMRFKSLRKTRMGYFETLEWSLELEGGEKVSLLDVSGNGPVLQQTGEIALPA